MSDISKYDDPEEEEQLAKYLTKVRHNDKDLHQVGDTLPDSIVSYNDGNQTVTNDRAGNVPKMRRGRWEVFGNNTIQGCTNAWTQLANMSLAVTAPAQAGTPHVIVSYQVQFYSAGGGGGGDNWAQADLWLNGASAGKYTEWSAGWAPVHIGRYTGGRYDIAIGMAPGQTITLQLMVFMGNPAAASTWTYNSAAFSWLTQLSAELYY